MKKTRDDIQKECISTILKFPRACAAVGMGVGKTYIGLKYIQSLQYFSKDKDLKVLIVAPKLSIIDNWKTEAEKFSLNETLKDATFCTYLSLKKQTSDYDVIILDEAHSLLESHDDYLKNVNSKILGLTGTPPRHKDSIRGQLFNKYCPIKYEYVINDAVDDNILNNYIINVHMISLSNDKNIEVKTKNATFYTAEVNNYMYWTKRLEEATSQKSKQIASIMRMKAMMEFPSKEAYANDLLNKETDKCILFCNTQKQADKLCKHSYHSNNPDSEENLLNFKDGNITKLSCVLQLSEGVNIPNLKSGIIMHAYGNERKSSQRLARMLRLNPKDTAVIHVLCYKNTVDEKWVASALEDFDQSKINYLN
jgi:superfamily II DNA or RNA helicase